MSNFFNKEEIKDYFLKNIEIQEEICRINNITNPDFFTNNDIGINQSFYNSPTSFIMNSLNELGYSKKNNQSVI